MNLDQLKTCLRPWMVNSTWHTGHPLDEERFHKALLSAFNQLGVCIQGDQFEEVIDELAEEFHPTWDKQYRDEIVNKFVLKAECISSYLFDTRK